MLCERKIIRFPFFTTLIAIGLIGCGVDRDSAEYDERRYKELQKSNCDEMAALLAKPLLTEKPQDYDAVVKRCRDLKSLTPEEYRRLSQHARDTGSWDIYEVFPEKRTVEGQSESSEHIHESSSK